MYHILEQTKLCLLKCLFKHLIADLHMINRNLVVDQSLFFLYRHIRQFVTKLLEIFIENTIRLGFYCSFIELHTGKGQFG
jgi:hypothetical protein